jgi:hypothetical protein
LGAGGGTTCVGAGAAAVAGTPIAAGALIVVPSRTAATIATAPLMRTG